jgi:hypothetical protein
VAIDVFSRKTYAEPRRNKNGNSVKEAFIKMTGIVQPRSTMSDHEPAFLGNEFS